MLACFYPVSEASGLSATSELREQNRALRYCESSRVLVVRGGFAVSRTAQTDPVAHETSACNQKLSLCNEENRHSLLEALNFASALATLQRFKEAKSLMRKAIPMARRVFGKSHNDTLKLTWSFARTLYEDPGATLDDLRESVTTHEETARIARRVLGGTHPTTVVIEESLRNARAVLRARETPTDELDEVENA